MNNNLMLAFNSIMNDVKDSGKRALREIPVELLAWDSSYQTWERTSNDSRMRQIRKLANKWDENKLEPITVVPHPEEGKFYIVNGYGRYMASQLLFPKYEYLCATILLGAMNMSDSERRIFESELFAYQNREVSPLKPLQIHGALLNIGYPAVTLFERLKNEYGFRFTSGGGSRMHGVIGSYSKTLAVAQSHGEECLRYIFDVCKASAFNRKDKGYSTYVILSLRDAWLYHKEYADITEEYLGKTLRKLAPDKLRKLANGVYPDLSAELACSLYIEDLFVADLGLDRKREYKDGKVVKIA